jgi:hypothetical protein
VLAWNPTQGRYSPLWDVHLAQWTNPAIPSGQNLRQTDFGTVENLAQDGLVTAPNGGAFGASGFILSTAPSSVWCSEQTRTHQSGGRPQIGGLLRVPPRRAGTG